MAHRLSRQIVPLYRKQLRMQLSKLTPTILKNWPMRWKEHLAMKSLRTELIKRDLTMLDSTPWKRLLKKKSIYSERPLIRGDVGGSFHESSFGC